MKSDIFQRKEYTHMDVTLSYLFMAHLLKLLLPGVLLAALVCGRRGQVLQDVGVSLMAEGREVADVQFQLTAVLIEVYEWGDNLSKNRNEEMG